MRIRPDSEDRYLRSLRDGDRGGSRRILDSLRERPGSAGGILEEMARFAGLHVPRPGEVPATVVIDAVADLAPTYGEVPPVDLLARADAYLHAIRTGRPDMDRPEAAAKQPGAGVVPVSSLEDALAEGGADRIRDVLERLKSAIGSPEYLLEVLLDAVAPENTPDGRLLVHASAAVKRIHSASWDAAGTIVSGLVAALADEPILPAPLISEMPAPVPCRAGFLESLDRDRPELFWLYLSHAFQAARYAQLRQKGVRWGLRAWIVERLFAGQARRMDAEEEALGPPVSPRAGAEGGSLPDGEGRALAVRFAAGDPRAASEAADWAGRLEDVDPLFRWIAEAAADALGDGNPAPLVAANAARWGAHLLGKQQAGGLVERLVERMAGLRDGGS